MRYEKVTITPNKAKQLLSNNPINRKIKDGVVATYAKAMKDGQWNEDSPEALAVSVSGKLQQGQHRLHAIIKSGVTLSLWVAFDCPDGIIDFLDMGVKRTAQDVFKMKGILNGGWLSTGIKGYMLLERGCHTLSSGMNGRQITTHDLLNEYNSRPDYWQSIFSKANRWYSQFSQVASPQFIFSYYTWLSEISQSDADIFFERLCTGVGIISDKDPVKVLRNIFIRNKQENHKRKSNASYMSVLTVKAWNYFRAKKEITLLKFDKERDEMPKPI